MLVKLKSIIIGKRERQSFSGIKELAESISLNGLIHPICVKDLGDGTYRLLAGERRYKAHLMLSTNEIKANVFDHDLSPFEEKRIELTENLDREDLTIAEEVTSKKALHDLFTEEHGDGSTGGQGDGWSIRSTALHLGESHTQVADDIRLAEAMEVFPAIKHCTTKAEMKAKLRQLTESVVVEEQAKRAEAKRDETPQDQQRSELAKCYIHGDFFELIKRVPDGSVDIVEVDPPYAISIVEAKSKLKDGEARTKLDEYNEIRDDVYPAFVKGCLSECYRVMAEDSWLIFWFSTRFWYYRVQQEIYRAEFEITAIPGLWIKPHGLANSPRVQMAANYETFFYARKGAPSLTKPGRLSTFNYKQVAPASKIHPTERPIELMQDILSSFGSAGARVLVPFAGSGNTLLAACNLGMSAFGYDLSEAYRNPYIMRVVDGEYGEYKSFAESSE